MSRLQQLLNCYHKTTGRRVPRAVPPSICMRDSTSATTDDNATHMISYQHIYIIYTHRLNSITQLNVMYFCLGITFLCIFLVITWRGGWV